MVSVGIPAVIRGSTGPPSQDHRLVQKEESAEPKHLVPHREALVVHLEAGLGLPKIAEAGAVTLHPAEAVQEEVEQQALTETEITVEMYPALNRKAGQVMPAPVAQAVAPEIRLAAMAEMALSMTLHMAPVAAAEPAPQVV